jgi:hypothetical protein
MSRDNSICTGCSEPIPPRPGAMFHDGQVYHFRCFSEHLRVEALALEERSRLGDAEAKPLIERARELRERSLWLREIPDTGSWD